MNFALCLTFGMKSGVAGEMLHVAEAFIDKHYHPTVICRGELKEIKITFFLVIFLSCTVSDLILVYALFFSE